MNSLAKPRKSSGGTAVDTVNRNLGGRGKNLRTARKGSPETKIYLMVIFR